MSLAVMAAEPPARFRDLLAAEWLKFRSLRAGRSQDSSAIEP